MTTNPHIGAAPQTPLPGQDDPQTDRIPAGAAPLAASPTATESALQGAPLSAAEREVCEDAYAHRRWRRSALILCKAVAARARALLEESAETDCRRVRALASLVITAQRAKEMEDSYATARDEPVGARGGADERRQLDAVEAVISREIDAFEKRGVRLAPPGAAEGGSL